MFLPIASSALLFAGLAAATPTAKRADNCACGYKDSNGNVWRESIISDFTAAAGALAAVNADFSIQTWGSQHTNYYMQNSASNVFQYQDALGLKTSAYNGDGKTYVSEIDSKRNDILYGTFRMKAQIPSVPGVCFGFFTFKSDTQEVDIEFLSSDPTYYNTIHYTNQPGTVNGNVDNDSYKVATVNGDLTEFGEHRFDWLPGQSVFYWNQAKTATISKNSPTTPSYIIAQVWSDGGQWTQGPPANDAVATIQYIHQYFNSTKISESAFNSACTAAGRPAACSI